jgi:hypothetical protein
MRRARGQQRREVWRAEGLLCDTSLPRAILEITSFSYFIRDRPRRCQAISWGRLRTALPRSRMSSIMSRNVVFGGGVEILVESHRGSTRRAFRREVT